MPGEPSEVIDDKDELLRRFVSFAVKDGIVTSAAFKRDGKPDPEPSVDLARITTAQRCFDFGKREGLGIGVLATRAARQEGLDVKHTPDENPAHCVITGKHTKATCRKLAEATHVLHLPGELKLTPASKAWLPRWIRSAACSLKSFFYRSQ